ncbi:hypothetical protein ALC53_09154 [Atta colombica]|uniref:Uncharacterized protein n=1 Tax=Atta colombica TaxID=520822 RepID=A0A151I1E7_9HYME|nr:hypothetical protein ALC53_09154 [Atta colombica]
MAFGSYPAVDRTAGTRRRTTGRPAVVTHGAPPHQHPPDAPLTDIDSLERKRSGRHNSTASND